MSTTANVKDTAAAMRQELRRAFPETRFSLRMATGTAYGWVDVFWTDGPCDMPLRKVLTPFLSMTYDTMQDCTVPTGVSAWSCTGVSYHREISKQLRKEARSLLKWDTDGAPFIHDDATGRSYCSAMVGDGAETEVLDRFLRDYSA